MESLYIDWHPVVAAVVLMLFDIATGFIGAVKAGEVTSSKMRNGLWHKAGFCLLIILAWFYEVAAAWIDFEVASVGLNVAVPDLPAVGVICVYIILTEVVSIVENISELNPKIAELPVIDRLKIHDPDSADLSVEVVGDNDALLQEAIALNSELTDGKGEDHE